jgi:hypothetical protein
VGGLSGFLPTYDGWVYPAIWAASLIIFAIELFVLRRHLGASKGGDVANRSVGVAWSGAGFAIFTLFVSAAVVSWRTHSDAAVMLLPSIVLASYGMCWMVAAAVTRKAWTRAAALGSYVGAVVVAALSGERSLYLVFALALMLLAVAPGVALVRQAKAAA